MMFSYFPMRKLEVSTKTFHLLQNEREFSVHCGGAPKPCCVRHRSERPKRESLISGYGSECEILEGGSYDGIVAVVDAKSVAPAIRMRWRNTNCRPKSGRRRNSMAGEKFFDLTSHKCRGVVGIGKVQVCVSAWIFLNVTRSPLDCLISIFVWVTQRDKLFELAELGRCQQIPV